MEKVSKIHERGITDGGWHKQTKKQSLCSSNSDMAHETEFFISNQNDKLNYQNKGKTLSDFTAQQICNMFFQAPQSLWQCWKTVEGKL